VLKINDDVVQGMNADLFTACASQHTAVIAWLLEKGVDVNSRDKVT